MPKLSLLLSLLCAATFCVSGHPYSKLQETVPFGDGLTAIKSSASSIASTYSHANQDNIKIGGIHNGQVFTGTKSSAYSQSGGSHSASFSSASVSGVIPIGLMAGTVTGTSPLGYGALHNAGTGFVDQHYGSVAGSSGYSGSAQGSLSGQQHQYGSSSTGSAGLSGYDANAQGSSTGQYQNYGSSPTGNAGSSSYDANAQGSSAGQYQNYGSSSTGNAGSSGYNANAHGSSTGQYQNQGSSSTGTAGSYGYDANAQDSSAGQYQKYGVPSTVNSGSQQAGIQQTGSQAVGSQFWWMGPNSPFVGVGKESGGCTSNGCLATITYVSGAQKGGSGAYAGNNAAQAGIKLQGNPFLHGAGAKVGGSSVGSSSYGSTGSGSSSFASSGSAGSSNTVYGSTKDVSKNPFLNGVEATAGSSSSGHDSGVSSSGTQTNLSGGSTSFLNSGSSGSTIEQVAQSPVIIPSVSTGFGNPFFKPQVTKESSYPKYPLVSVTNHIVQVSEGEGNAQSEQQADISIHPFPIGEQPLKQEPRENNQFQVTCSGEGRVCVQFYHCSSDGYVITKGLPQLRSGPQVCDLNNEVCCVLKSTDQSTVGTSSGGIFGRGNNDQQQTEITTGELYPGGVPAISNNQAESNGYLPPIGSAPSSNVPAFTNPPKDEEGGSSSPDSTNIFPPAPAPPPQVGCAAALLCVEERFCSLEGVITTEPVSYTPQQLERGVPLSTCKNPDNGVVGKCCRDPNYVDPWPAGNLPANYSGGFDEQGFPTILNIAKTRPTKKRPYTGGASNGAAPAIKTSFSAPNRGQAIPASPSRPRQVPTAYPKPVEIPQAPYNEVVQSPTPFALLEPQNPFKVSYVASPSNQYPTSIPPHVPGGQCGLINKVRRPDGLIDVDVAFGEIPWQAMVLSRTDRKLLCSGAIIAPNAVVTSARCIKGFTADNVAIKAGEWKLGYELKHEEPLPYEIVNVVYIAPYPASSSGNLDNNIAILFLEHDIKLDQHIDTICLPQGAPQPGRKCIATGWGKIVLQENIAGSLMHGIDVDVLDNEQCRQRISNAESQIPLDDSLICTKAHKQNNNMCQVDFGGPLACDRGDGYYELAGIYNLDTGCLPTNQVATFSTIPTRWIEETLSKPLSYSSNEYQSPTNVRHDSYVHNHGSNEPCNCQEKELQSSGTSQYLPPV